MNRLSALVVSIFAVALALAAPSCSSGANCTVANCAGCCTKTGICSRGDTAANCGKNGISCVECSGAQGCDDTGMCADGAGGGDTGTGGGTFVNGGGTQSGGGGGAQSGGGGAQSGGGGGAQSGGGGASQGGGGTAGGSSGGASQGGGSSGGGGTLATCGPSNCASGCCVGSTCVMPAQQNNSQCGVGGNGCLMCAGGNTCQSGQCMGTVMCGPANCAGCCSNNACVPTAQQGNGACGSGGNACAMCSGSQTCQSGMCQTPATLGGPCTSAGQCSTLGAGATCKQATSTGNATYSGGFCTVPCTTSGASCASGNGVCLGGSTTVLPYYGEGDLFCSPTCAAPGTQSSCRAGYACYGSTTGFCWLDPVPAFDGGGVDTKVGNGCTSDTACQNPPSPDFGYCVAATDTGGNPTGFTGGYCTADCSLDNTDTFCGPNGACFGFTQDDGGTFFACLRLCTNPGGGKATRNGYSCFTGTDVDGGAIGYVFPSCDNTVNLCPPNLFCNSTTGYCCDGGFCQN